MAEVTLSNISKSFGSQTALDDVSMTIPDGSFVVLLGPTGAGKTTTISMLTGLVKPNGGSAVAYGLTRDDVEESEQDQVSDAEAGAEEQEEELSEMETILTTKLIDERLDDNK